MREARRLIMRAIDDLEEGADVEGVIFLLDDALGAMTDRRKYLSQRSPQEERWTKPSINMRAPKGTKKARRQSAKQKLLTQLADKKWKSYKRKYPKGKKTYITIRAQVSRSQIYKKKAKRLG